MVRHSIAATVFASLIARADSNYNDRMLEIVALGALLHDVGMSHLPVEVYDLNRKLKDEEYHLVKQHTTLGVQISSEVTDFPDEVKKVIEQHHEDFDGNGYPQGLKGDEIYYPARIVMIADCFSALTTRRAGRALFPPEEALAIMLLENRKYDPKLLASFETLLFPKKKKTG